MTLWLAIMAAAAEPAAHGETSGGLPQLDLSTYPSQIFWLAITFATLYAVMSTMVLPRLGGAIEERRDRIADDYDQAAEFRRQAQEAEAAYNKALADARAKAQGIAAETRSVVEAEIAEVQSDAAAKIEASLAVAEERIDRMKSEASAKVRDAARDVTKAVVSALIDETPADEAVSAAIASATR